MNKSINAALAVFLALVLTGLGGCNSEPGRGPEAEAPFVWNNAHVYFLLTDRFLNANPDNDVNYGRNLPTAVMRGFEGGDLQGVIQKLEEGYFSRLGVTALWLTPWFEQNRGITDEGTGATYAYHGYWTQDWTSIEPNLGSEEDLARLIELAHAQGIRVVMDVIINHTGPVTDQDPVWPADWVRTGPPCAFTTYDNTIACTLVENLPDILTASNETVDLPPSLLARWEAQGRLEQELDELDAFFARTGYPRAPRYYIIKWLTDYIRKYGIDGFRLDTAKHVEEWVWKELKTEAGRALAQWKKEHPDEVLDGNDFFMVGEVYNYNIHSGRFFDFGDRKVDFYAQDIHSLINFSFKSDAEQAYETHFSFYSDQLQGDLKGQGVLNYLASHDDHYPYDPGRNRPLEAGTRLLLSPGASQLYYGDETSRILKVEGAEGDAHLRSNMNWSQLEDNATVGGVPVQEVFAHYEKLGQFRKEHPAVGAGVHRMITAEPYVFSREFSREGYEDRVLVGLDLQPGEKTLEVGSLFPDGTRLFDYYSGQEVRIKKGLARVDSPWNIVLLGRH